ncbi:MAG TPA: stage II sporulation protein M [Candidatus Xenobia bacterium]|jgi:uncharacterized membrane protein SpoIIM required for sporulation
MDRMENPPDRLEAILDQVDRHGLNSLSANQVLELGRRYRQTASGLSRARSRGKNNAELDRLNRLVARAYACIYTAPAAAGTSMRDLLLDDFPRAVNQYWRYIAAAVLACVVGMVMGAAMTALNPQMPDVLLGSGWSNELQRLADRHAGVKNWLPDTERPMASATIITNNIRVSILAYSTGLLLGLGPLYLMWYNGVMLGAIAFVVGQAGVATSFWAFVAPHGVIELSAIFISGGAGLLMADAAIRPGPYTRGEAIRRAGQASVALMVGVIAMLLVAGTMEAFFDPVPEIPYAAKFLAASVLFLCMVSFFRLRGHPHAVEA